MPKVWNKAHGDAPRGAVYCGRGSPWGNPFKLGRDGSRDQVCDRFEKEVLPDLDVTSLRGKDLLCFCAPKRCHVDAIFKKANAPLVRQKPLRLIFDAETDGLLRQVTVCHCLVIKDADTGQVWRFRKNKREDTIAKGLAMLDTADLIFGHNIVGYDIPMFEKLFDWTPQAKIRDTLVLCRLLFPDQKDKDFRLHEQGKLDGKLIGSHNLDSWGQRVGLYKGDYKKKKEAEAVALGILPDSEEMRLFVWGQWTEELEDYCQNDVDTTDLVMQMAELRESSDDAIWVQHMLTDLMCRQQESGFFFDSESALELSSELKIARCKLEEKLDVEFPGRWLPAKRIDQCPFPELFTEEDIDTIRWFGVSQIRKTDSPKYKDPLRARWDKGSVYTPIKWQEFNPRSRPQITDRLQEMGWEPEDEDYTEKGNVKANDVILRRISEVYPVAETLADLMAVNKLMGQLADGKNSWLNMVDDDGFIRAYVNPCGAVTTRATHSYPNLAQIPAIKTKKVAPSEITWEGGNAFIHDKKGKLIPVMAKAPKPDADPDEKVTVKLLGMAGGWGIESRRLFCVPEGWSLVGSDLAGIELRCLAHRMAKYDAGAYGKVLLEGDIHSENQSAAGLDSRDTAKTFIYAFLYGAGDEKIGKIISPLSPPHVQRKIGKELKSRFLKNIPALGRVIRDTQQQARRKYIVGLDGRRLFVRSKHAALNTDLQGMGATIANWWLIFIEEKLTEAGLVYGWDDDYTFCAWVHDEVQIACRIGLEEIIMKICIEAAAEAGVYLGFSLPVDASASHGINWSETH
jgi:hypothetical protein